MKVLFCLVAVALIGYVSSETCGNTNDCHVTLCGAGYTVTCVNHECTCVSSTGNSCTVNGDCPHTGCNNGRIVCRNGQCECHHFPGGGK